MQRQLRIFFVFQRPSVRLQVIIAEGLSAERKHTESMYLIDLVQSSVHEPLTARVTMSLHHSSMRDWRE